MSRSKSIRLNPDAAGVAEAHRRQGPADHEVTQAAIRRAVPRACLLQRDQHRLGFGDHLFALCALASWSVWLCHRARLRRGVVGSTPCSTPMRRPRRAAAGASVLRVVMLPLVTQYQHAVHKRFLVDLWFAWSSPSGGRFANGPLGALLDASLVVSSEALPVNLADEWFGFQTVRARIAHIGKHFHRDDLARQPRDPPRDAAPRLRSFHWVRVRNSRSPSRLFRPRRASEHLQGRMRSGSGIPRSSRVSRTVVGGTAAVLLVPPRPERS